MKELNELFNNASINGLNEPIEMEYVKKTIKPGSIVFDIGANIGIYSLLFSNLVGEDGHVYSFEPNKELFRVKEPNVTLINSAVSSASGKGKLYLCKTNSGDGRIFYSKCDPNRETMDIDIITVDEYVISNKITKIDFIKIDAQGSEPCIIKGMLETLKITNPIIFTEFWPYGYKLTGFESKVFIDMMNNMGYKHTVLENTCSKKDRNFDPNSIAYLLSKSQNLNDWTVNLIWERK